jgi:3-methyladenine DNA glycosylase AlkD
MRRKTAQSHVQEIEKRLARFPKRTSAHNPETYIGGGQSNLRYLGLRVPHLNQALKEGFSFSSSESDQVARIWNDVFHHTDCYEVMALALSWFYEPEQRDHLTKHWPILKKWAPRIDNWAHSDELCGIYARILDDNRDLVYPTLVRWNRSREPWLRRISIVSLLYYSKLRSNVLPFRKLIGLIEAQIDFDHYFVQKGVGWSLREVGNVYPDLTYRFIEKNIARLSPTAFSPAIEKMSKAQRENLKRLRR